MQETLLAAIQSIDQFSGSSSLFSWLTGVLKHKIVDCVRRSVRDQWQEMDNEATPTSPDDRDFAAMMGTLGASGGFDGPE